MILFAGGWSDKRGKRKPCMLIPMIGELAALLGKCKQHSEDHLFQLNSQLTIEILTISHFHSFLSLILYLFLNFH